MIIELKDHVNVARGDGTFYVAHKGRRVNYHCQRRLDRSLVHAFSVYEAKTCKFHLHKEVSTGDSDDQGRPKWL